MHHLSQLKIWSKAIDLSVYIYEATSAFPKEEVYGLTAQLRRAAISVASNISEGAGRVSDKEFIYFLGIANGSTYELQTQLIIAHKLKLLPGDTLNRLLPILDEIQKMNYQFQKHLKTKLTKK